MQPLSCSHIGNPSDCCQIGVRQNQIVEKAPSWLLRSWCFFSLLWVSSKAGSTDFFCESKSSSLSDGDFVNMSEILVLSTHCRRRLSETALNPDGVNSIQISIRISIKLT